MGQKAESGQSGDETLIRLIQILLGNLLIQAGQCSAKLEWIADSDLKARILLAYYCHHCQHPELRNVKSFTRIKSSRPNFTPRKAHKLPNSTLELKEIGTNGHPWGQKG